MTGAEMQAGFDLVHDIAAICFNGRLPEKCPPEVIALVLVRSHPQLRQLDTELSFEIFEVLLSAAEAYLAWQNNVVN